MQLLDAVMEIATLQLAVKRYSALDTFQLRVPW